MNEMEKRQAQAQAIRNLGVNFGGTAAQFEKETQKAAQQIATQQKPAAPFASRDLRETTNDPKQKLQKKKEDQLEAKVKVDPVKIKRDRVKKQYDDYIASDEYKQRKFDYEKKAAQDAVVNMFLNPGSELQAPKVYEDEKEQLLRAAREQAEAEYNASEDQKVIEGDLEAIAGLSEEERKQLEQYFVDRDLDYYEGIGKASQGDFWNLPVGRAEQTAAGLIEKYGAQRVREMANTLDRIRNAEMTQSVAELGQQHANSGFWGGAAANAASVPASILSGPSGVIDRAKEMTRRDDRFKTLDPNSIGNLGNVYSSALRGQAAQNIEEKLGGGFVGKAASLGYQGLMSAADSVARAYLGGGAWGGAALAATNTFSQTMADASKQGASPAQAALLATSTAAIEALSEKIPLDKLIKQAGGGKQAIGTIVKNALIQAGVEATTEEISLVGSLLAEAAILREKSDYEQTALMQIMQGKSPTEARAIAAQQVWDEVVNTALVSAASGGFSSGAAGAMGNVRANMAEASPQGAEEIKQQALEKVNALGKQGQEAVQQPVQQEQKMPSPEETTVTVKSAGTALTEQNKEKNTLAYTLASNIDSVRDMAPVSQLTGREFNDRSKKMTEQIRDFFKSLGNIVVRAGFGDVSLGEYGIGGILNRSKMVSLAAVPDVIKNGRQIAYEPNWKGRGYETYTFAAPVTVNGTEVYVAAVVNRKPDNKFYLSEMVDSQGNYVRIEESPSGNSKYGVTDGADKSGEAGVPLGPEGLSEGSNSPAKAEPTLLPNSIIPNEQGEVNGNSGNVERTQQADTHTGMQMGASNMQEQSAEGGQIKGTGAAEGNFSAKPAYNATLSADNAQPDRAGDVRSMELPQRDINGGNISAVTGNVYGAGVTPDEFASLMEEPTARGDFSYVPISNNEAAQAAMGNISRYGWQDAYAQWSADVRSGTAGAEMSARGALLLNHAAQAGDRQQWLNILSDFQRLGTNTAQGLQAFRILRNLTPSDRLYMMRRSVAQMVEDMHLNVPIQINQQLADRYQNAQTNEEADAILDEIISDVAAQIPSTIGDRWTALRYVNMLGNMRTQVRNISGNIGAKFTYMAKDQIGAALEKAVRAVNHNFRRTKSAFVSRELKELGRADFDEVRDIVLENGRFDDARRFDSTYFAREVNDRRRIFNNRILEGYRRLTNWAMNNDHFGDAGFARSAYARAFGGYLKANGFTGNTLEGVDQNLLDDARLYAIQQAQESTFRDHNAISNWMSRIGRRQDTPRTVRALSEGVMPFRSTPANVLVRAEEFSPLGIVNTAVTAVQAARNGTDVTGTDVVESLAKTLTGTGLFILGSYLGKMGILSGGPDPDEEKAEFDQMNGYQNYALQLPDGKNITIDFMSPLAVPMFLGAELEKIISDGGYDLADFEAVFTSLADPLIQMSMLQGLNDTMDNIKYSENNLGQFFLNATMSYLTQGLTNTLLGQVERSGEKNRQTTFVDKDSAIPQWIQRQLGKQSQKIPGWDYQQMDYRNAWGQTEENEGGLLYNLLSPGYLGKEKRDALTTEISRLREATGESVFPDTASKTISYTDKEGTFHEGVNLSAEQYQTLATTQGQTAKRILTDMIQSDAYAALSDEQKANAINLAYSYAKETGEMAAFPDSQGYSQSWMMEMKENKEADYILNRVGNAMLSGAMGKLDVAWDNNYSAANQKTLAEQLAKEFESYSKMPASAKKAIREEATGTTATYIAAREGGITHENSLKTIKAVDSAGTLQKDKMTTIAKQSHLSESQKVIMGKLYGTDAQDENIDEVAELTQKLKAEGVAIPQGSTFKLYTELYRDHEDYTHGTGKKDRTTDHWVQKYGISKKTAKVYYELFS